MVVIREVAIMGQMMVMMTIVEEVEIVVIEVVEKMVVMPRMSMALSISRFYQKFLPVGSSKVKPAILPVSRLSMFALC